LNNITSRRKKEEKILHKIRGEKVALQMVQDIKRVTPFLIRVGRFQQKSEKKMLMDEKERGNRSSL
jgi:ppGpp synthetase/RelA/SpoT-type nucleotidyltranferase